MTAWDDRERDLSGDVPWPVVRSGMGSWEPSPAHDTPASILTAFLACLLGAVLLAGLVVAGRGLMCKAHTGVDRPGYCTQAVPR